MIFSVSHQRKYGEVKIDELPMRCNPLTVTGPVPAFSRMVTGAFSSKSPRLTWETEGTRWDTPRPWTRHAPGLEMCAVPWAGSWGAGWRWAPSWSFPGGSWPWPPPHCSPPWPPRPDKPVTMKHDVQLIWTSCWQSEQSMFESEETPPWPRASRWSLRGAVWQTETVHTVLSSRNCSRSSSSSPWNV